MNFIICDSYEVRRIGDKNAKKDCLRVLEAKFIISRLFMCPARILRLIVRILTKERLIIEVGFRRSGSLHNFQVSLLVVSSDGSDCEPLSRIRQN